ncbi:hypothetical protein [Streptomyces roseifaciens]|uniref:hypothetical protein n=1 Tax=Streptomyces roseifaciens TaxID=1488406 RepID=UPI000717F69A|nr:hypothetical protein [Streptomyces roseifaciens]
MEELHGRTALDEVLLDRGVHDPALFAARHRGQPSALSTTAGYALAGPHADYLEPVVRRYAETPLRSGG